MNAVPVLAFSPLEAAAIVEVAALEARVSPEPWSAKLFEGELDLHTSARNWILASYETAAGPELAGFGGMMFVEQEGHLMNIAVDPAGQQKGVATQILHRLTVDAIDRGVTDLTLEVRVNNAAALALYRRFGFAPVGVRKKYYVDGVDALIMWVHDINTTTYAQSLAKVVNR